MFYSIQKSVAVDNTKTNNIEVMLYRLTSFPVIITLNAIYFWRSPFWAHSLCTRFHRKIASIHCHCDLNAESLRLWVSIHFQSQDICSFVLTLNGAMIQQLVFGVFSGITVSRVHGVRVSLRWNWYFVTFHGISSEGMCVPTKKECNGSFPGSELNFVWIASVY